MNATHVGIRCEAAGSFLLFEVGIRLHSSFNFQKNCHSRQENITKFDILDLLQSCGIPEITCSSITSHYKAFSFFLKFICEPDTGNFLPQSHNVSWAEFV